MIKDLIPSCQIPLKQFAVIEKLEGDPSLILRIREMGFNEGTTISRANITHKKCIIINHKGKKFYFNEDIAHSILVRLI